MVTRELIVHSTSGGVDIALLEDKALVELHREDANSAFTVGDIFLGKIKRIRSDLNAAFVDVGYKKDAFLHYTDLGTSIKSLVKFTNYAIAGTQPHLLDAFKFEGQIVKAGRISNTISKKYPMLVQILKEPISTKGPRLSSEITLAGRYIVLVPFGNAIGISRKITSATERNRLQKLMGSIKPKNFGIVVRTVAEGESVANLHDDLNNLLNKWQEITHNLKGAVPPTKISSEINRTSRIIRDLLNGSFNNIVINDKKIYQEIKTYIQKIAPEKEKIVSLYTSNIPVFDHYHITRQIKSSFGKTVSMPSGAYIVIEHTEALHVVDVNSGHKVSAEGDQETMAFNVNLEAAKEIAHQLKLRDIGGIVVIDFIDMKNPLNRRKINDAMRAHMNSDRAKHSILPLSKIGLMEITRQRVRPQLSIATSEVCPTCSGTGKVDATLLLIDKIEKDIKYLLEEQNQSKVKLYVHPFVEAYLNKGFFSKGSKWLFKYFRNVKIYANDDYQLVEYHFFDQYGEELIMDN